MRVKILCSKAVYQIPSENLCILKLDKIVWVPAAEGLLAGVDMNISHRKRQRFYEGNECLWLWRQERAGEECHEMGVRLVCPICRCVSVALHHKGDHRRSKENVKRRTKVLLVIRDCWRTVTELLPSWWKWKSQKMDNDNMTCLGRRPMFSRGIILMENDNDDDTHTHTKGS